jgi:histidyl-tRNA synthetase
MAKFQPPRATRDYLPGEAAARRRVEAVFAQTAESYGYQPIQTPLYEAAELFLARSGPEVKSSMLTFHCDHEEFALRPELTAPVCRLLASGAFEQDLPPHRLYYVGPCFRYCRPQSGRYREFTQAGLECLGAAGPDADAEVIAAACAFLRAIGITNFSLRIGTSRVFAELLSETLDREDQAAAIGHLDRLIAIDEKCRELAESGDPGLFEDLKIDRMDVAAMQAEAGYEGPDAIAAHAQISSAEMSERLPREAEAALRHLWSVQELVPARVSEVLLRAARLRGPLEHVHQEAASLLAGTRASAALQELLDVSRHVEQYGLGEFEVVLGIARGFTFYTSTVFEISAGNGRGAVKYCGGGRYDRLVEEFGGPAMPSCGCAFRFDAIAESFIDGGHWMAPRAYQLVLVGAAEAERLLAVPVAEELRRQGWRVGVEQGAVGAVTAADCERHNTEWIGVIRAVQGKQPARVLVTNGPEQMELALDAAAVAAHLSGGGR